MIFHLKYFFHPGREQHPLFFQDLFSVFDGPVTLLNQFEILDQRFNREPGVPHAHDKFNPLDIDLAVIPDATGASIYRRE